MALATSVVNGAQNLIRNDIETRRYSIVLEVSETLGTTATAIVTEVTETKEEKWYALTKAAAQTELDANAQPAGDDETYTYDMQLENENIKAYSLTRTYQKVESSISPLLDVAPSVTFSPVAGLFPDGAKDITLNCTDADAWIFYETGAAPADPTTGSSRVPAGTEITITIPVAGSVTIKAFAYNIGYIASDITSAIYTDDEL